MYKKNKVSKFIVSVLMLITLLCFTACSDIDSNLTYSSYSKIENIMSYEEVVDILGEEGKLSTSAGSSGYYLEYYEWSNHSGTKIIVIGFENGRVCAKSQTGL